MDGPFNIFNKWNTIDKSSNNISFILADGTWNDNGIWDDDAEWNDGVDNSIWNDDDEWDDNDEWVDD
jgi:hypothetical protein